MKDGLPGEFINSLKLAPDGTLWIGTGFGPAVYRDHQISALAIDEEHGQKQIFDFYFEPDSP